MREAKNDGHNIVFTDLFAEQLDEVASKNTYERIKRRILTLGQFPSLGSPVPRPSLMRRFGPDIRVSPVGNHVIVYRESNEIIELLALVYGPTIP